MRKTGTLSRLLSQPIYRDAVINGKFFAGIVTIAVMLFSIILLISGMGLRMIGVPPSSEELVRLMTEHPDNYQHAMKIVNDDFVVSRTDQRPDVKIGVMGFPERASAELGRTIIEDIVKNAAARIHYLEENADGIYREVDFEPESLILK